LAAAKIPLLHVCGETDTVVPVAENSKLVEQRYTALGGPIELLLKPDVGHHPHSLKNCAPIVAFILKNTGGGTPDALLVESPASNQVFQRQSRASGRVRLAGLLATTHAKLEYRLVKAAEQPGASEQVVLDWQPLDCDIDSGRFDVEIDAPAGGWYEVQTRLADRGQTRATAVVGRIGVGEVFVVAGQSNSTNYGSERQKTVSGMVSSFDGRRWVRADDPQPGVQDGSGGGSFLPPFGDALAERLGVPIGVASTGAGATSVRQWLPKGERMTRLPTIASRVREVEPGVWECTGELFDGLMARVNALGAHGCRAILWHQGESDAGQARSGYPADRQISGDDYVAFMKTLIAASRKGAGWDIPWFVALTTYHTEDDASDEEFRAAQRALWMPGLAEQGPDTDALRKEFRDGVHFNGRGLRAHGQAWAKLVGDYLERLE
jgi:hypothetical protein